MANSDNDISYYIRVRGRVLGPYTVKQLQVLRERGQFSQSNEVSEDRVNWQSAATLELVFNTATKKSRTKLDAAQPVDVVPAEPAPTATPQQERGELPVWHYSVDQEQFGPVTLAELISLLANQKLSSRDLVWREGLAEWSPASEIAELRGIAQPRGRRGAKRSDGGANTVDSTPSDERATHFLDAVLRGLRSYVGPSDFATTGKAAVEVGRYAIYVSILANVVFYFLCAVKIDSISIGMMGLGFAAVALVLQYSAIKLCDTINLLIRATTLRMSSTAFIDSFAILMLVGGVVALTASAFAWMRLEKIEILLGGIALFVACEQLAMMALHPQAMGITITNRASSGEEAIAILSFFMMLPLRFVAGVFGLGTACSVLGTLWAFKPLLEGGIHRADALLISMTSAQVALICAAYPLVMYVYFVFAYLFVDVVRTILMLPDKLDQVKQAVEQSR